MGLGQSEHPVLTRRSGVWMAPHPGGRERRGCATGAQLRWRGWRRADGLSRFTNTLRVERRKLLQVHAAAELGSMRVPFMKPCASVPASSRRTSASRLTGSLACHPRCEPSTRSPQPRAKRASRLRRGDAFHLPCAQSDCRSSVRLYRAAPKPNSPNPRSMNVAGEGTAPD